ncbi:putative HTH-type transcriptional regulator YdcR [Aquimixticola soesokkakensis]|uniref:Putative HTH-type transcriptional regulator YdcR n=1 Tax=Aquimixticola soesokkakensis TaxID=1519096 RepID=A0A1Y5T5R4_9RHOB|nr:PLP-dependent aminotransferase family protein [Aquimixticola soesokkakensis]SLN56051.1 putative HTH-type transcriptional regulator YdcR [Aquimixticola soesokkakensis]
MPETAPETVPDAALQPSQSRTRRVMDHVTQLIARRELEAGEKLPSIRRCAAALSVSPSTVVEAYDRLVAQGVIYARRGAGFFVSDTAALRPRSLPQIDTARARDIDPLWVSRQSLDADVAAHKPGCGWLPADWMPTEAMRRALRGLARADDPLLAYYGSAKGEVALRNLLSRRFATQGLAAEPAQILLTASGSQAIDLICRLLLSQGDTVLVDDPCYFNFQALLRAHRIKLVSVPYTPEGPDIAAFEAALKTHRPRLYITNSALHNPTGATMSAQVAHRVLSLASAHDLTVIEDDIFAEFEPDLSPRLAALDGLQRVIRIGSFSKTLSASARCGFIAAHPDWIEALVDLQVATNFGGPSPLVVALIDSVLSDGSYHKHMEALRLRLAKRRREVARKLSGRGIVPWVQPRGGFYLWCELPDGVDAAEVARHALARDLVLAPGNVFSAAQNKAGFMRFNVSQMGTPEGFARLGEALQAARP